MMKVVVDEVGEKAQLCSEPGRGIVCTNVELPAVLRLEVAVAQEVLLGALVYTIGRQFSDVGCTESSCRIHSDVQLAGWMPHGSYTAGQTGEVAR